MGTETPISTLKGGHSNWVLCISWSPNGRYLLSGGMDGWVSLWNGEEFTLITTLKGHTKWITSVAWQPLHLDEECTLFASSSKDGTVRIWSRVSMSSLLCISAHQKCITKYEHLKFNFFRMLWGGQGFLYTASEDTTIGVWNKGGKKVQELKGHGHWVNSIALHTDFVLRCGCFGEDN